MTVSKTDSCRNVGCIHALHKGSQLGQQGAVVGALLVGCDELTRLFNLLLHLLVLLVQPVDRRPGRLLLQLRLLGLLLPPLARQVGLQSKRCTV